MAAVLLLAQLFSRRVHICHVATKQEIDLIRVAKEKGIKVGFKKEVAILCALNTLVQSCVKWKKLLPG